MSFSNNNCNRVPGPVRGNVTNGLCEKVSIQVDKVFDSCVSQETLTDITLVLSDISPEGLVEPFRFISGKSIASTAPIADLVVSELPEDSCSARVTGNVVIPVEVVFVDANGTQGMGYANIVVPKDIVMKVASPSVISYDVQAGVNAVLPEGTYVGNNTFEVACCVTIIMKIVIPVQLLVPSYGYTYIPPCQNFSEEVCSGVFDLPIYPDEPCQTPNGCNNGNV